MRRLIVLSTIDTQPGLTPRQRPEHAKCRLTTHSTAQCGGSDRARTLCTTPWIRVSTSPLPGNSRAKTEAREPRPRPEQARYRRSTRIDHASIRVATVAAGLSDLA